VNNKEEFIDGSDGWKVAQHVDQTYQGASRCCWGAHQDAEQKQATECSYQGHVSALRDPHNLNQTLCSFQHQRKAWPTQPPNFSTEPSSQENKQQQIQLQTEHADTMMKACEEN
jgi:hypothetical protein